MSHISLFTLTTALLASVAPAFGLLDHGLNHDQLALIRQQLNTFAKASWEYGTASEAYLEIDFPELSVYGPTPFPPPHSLNTTAWPISNAKYLIDTKGSETKALMDDGAAGDPMSNGISVLLANATYPDDNRYHEAFKDQLDFIEHVVPKDPVTGAISHRTEYVQLWSDNVFMVPPVLAYYGALLEDPDEQWKYLNMAYQQIRAYRETLRDDNGLWKHVVGGPWEDAGHWSTGQGWAAAGILRVYQTIAKSSSRATMEWALPDLCDWAQEIVTAVWQHQQADGSLTNYLDRDGSFQEMSSTALMAAVTYRLALITDATVHIPAADKAFALVKQKIDDQGKLQNVVNPYEFSTPYYDVSPEGQAMVLMLQAAYRDYQSFSNNINSSITDVFRSFADAIAAAKGTTPPRAKRGSHARRWGSRH